MNVLAVIDAMSVELLFSKTQDRSVLASRFQMLEPLLFDDISQRLFSLMVRRSTPSNGAEPEIALVLEALAALRNHLLRLNDSRAGEVRAARNSTHLEAVSEQKENPLKYDTSHSAEVLETFLLEFSAHVRSIEDELHVLKSRPEAPEALQAAFRAFHSLKGNCGFVDLHLGRELCHQAETVLDRVRKGSSPLTSAACAALSNCVNVLRQVSALLAQHLIAPSLPFPAAPLEYEWVMKEIQDILDVTPLPRARPRIEVLNSPPPGPGASSSALLVQIDPPASESGPRAGTSGLTRVPISKLDELRDSSAELAAVQEKIERRVRDIATEDAALRADLADARRLSARVQDLAQSMRRVPVREAFKRLARMALDLARKQDKSIEMTVSGGEMLMDRTLLEALADPLMHLLTNAIDHGVDLPANRSSQGKPGRARIGLAAAQLGDCVALEISDDGNGLDYARIETKARECGLLSAGDPAAIPRLHQILFEPGFSTAANVTEVSGRGVGLDAVKRTVEALGGRVAVRSKPGDFTAFAIQLPAAAAPPAFRAAAPAVSPAPAPLIDD